MSHWCRDIQRDEAVRAAEDNRSGPLPTLEQAIAAVTERRPPEPGEGRNVTGSRTERVTLEITHQHLSHASAMDWPYMVANYFHRNGESVRVVDEAHFDDLAEVSMERDAAIRERDALKARVAELEQARERFDTALEEARTRSGISDFIVQRDEALEELETAIRERDEAKEECERLREKVRVMDGLSRMDIEKEIAVEEAWESCDIRPYWPDDEPGTSHRYAHSMMLEIVKLRARVDELEAAAKLAPAANADAVSNPRPISGAGKSAGEETQAASGAAGTEPVAWAILRGGHFIVATVNEIAANESCIAANESCKGYGGTVVPLYAAPVAESATTPQTPPGWLTAEERGSIQHAANLAKASWSYSVAQELENILARSSPPEVVHPECVFDEFSGCSAVHAWNICAADFRKALAAAGVKVKEVGK